MLCRRDRSRKEEGSATRDRSACCAGDQLVKEIDEAKEPAKAIEANPSPAGDAQRTGSPLVKYWQEYAPDPIRTGEGASGEPLALRCDGPVGYTFDLETEAGRFDQPASWSLQSPTKVRPWSLVKLRFRRDGGARVLVNPAASQSQKPVSLPTNMNSFKRFPLASARSQSRGLSQDDPRGPRLRCRRLGREGTAAAATVVRINPEEITDPDGKASTPAPCRSRRKPIGGTRCARASSSTPRPMSGMPSIGPWL